jgi:hypothetical protein
MSPLDYESLGGSVAMLDLLDLTLHRPSREHLVTACGIGPLGRCKVGPAGSLRLEAQQLCTSCYAVRSRPGVDTSSTG